MPPSADISAQPAQTNQRSAAGSLARRLTRSNEIALLVSLLIILIVFSLSSEHFLSVRNIANVFGQAAVMMMLALGVAIVFISGEVDISVGSLVAAVAIPLIELMNLTESLALGIAGAFALGLVIGAINGYLSAYLRINSLIVTLGAMFVIRGLVYLYTGKRAIPDVVYLESFFQIGNERLFGIAPYPALFAIAMLVFLMFVMRNTRFGRQVYAAGSNREVARLSGYDVRWIKFCCFLISAVLATAGGVLLSSRVGSAVHTAGIGYEFQAVAAVVLGGVSLAGGIGSLAGVALGVLILAFVSNGLNMLDAPTEWQMVITGAVIIAALALDAAKKRRS